MAFDAAGHVYLLDTNQASQSRILKLSSDGIILADWRGFKSSVGIALDSKGNVYITDGKAAQILELSPQGRVLRRFGHLAGGFQGPAHLAVDHHGNVYLSVAERNLIEKFDPDGALLASWHRHKGSGRDQWNQPQTISMAPDGTLAIDDWGNDRVEILSPAGKTLRIFRAIGRPAGKLGNASGTCVGPNGNIYAADYDHGLVQEFDAHGWRLRTIGNIGGRKLFQTLPGPYSLAVDSHNDLYSADGHTVVKYSPAGRLLARWN